MQKITPCLWFDSNAEAAVEFYTSVFKDSGISAITHYGKGAPMAEGTAMTISFMLDGQQFLALNGGPIFTFSPAISFIANCISQEDIDHLWEKLSEGGETQQCGWLKDKFSISWQIVPTALGEMLSIATPEQSQRIMTAVLQMEKLDLHRLEQAFKNG